MVQGSNIKFISFNCKGLNNPSKRSKVLHHLRHLDAHIVYLQETHLRDGDQARLRCGWVGQVYHSSFLGRSRGAAILLHKSLPFVHSKVISDPNGRFIIVTGQMYNINIVLANVYAPNWDDDSFFKRLFSKLPDLSTHHLILRGDFNTWLNSQLDRSSSNKCSPSKSSKIIQAFMNEFSVSDVWRFFNPSRREYSFFSSVRHTHTRIDYFLIDNNLLSSVSSCKYEAIVISDHSPVSKAVYFKDRVGSRIPWRLDTSLLSDQDFC